jgi:hypothetical protein
MWTLNPINYSKKDLHKYKMGRLLAVGTSRREDSERRGYGVCMYEREGERKGGEGMGEERREKREYD